MPQESEKMPEGYVVVNGDLGFFLDASKYAPILNINDEAAVMLRLSLIIENFLEVFINNVRQPGTENFVRPSRYFMPKVELSVALGLPISIANALVKLNSVRNKFAHKIDYVMSESDFNEIDIVVNAINVETVNPLNRFNMDSIQYMFDAGVDSLVFVRSLHYSTPAKQKRLYRLIGAVYILANKCAFFTLNELQRQNRLSFGKPMSDQKP